MPIDFCRDIWYNKGWGQRAVGAGDGPFSRSVYYMQIFLCIQRHMVKNLCLLKPHIDLYLTFFKKYDIIVRVNQKTDRFSQKNENLLTFLKKNDIIYT